MLATHVGNTCWQHILRIGGKVKKTKTNAGGGKVRKKYNTDVKGGKMNKKHKHK
jgi:hypothetical protein